MLPIDAASNADPCHIANMYATYLPRSKYNCSLMRSEIDDTHRMNIFAGPDATVRQGVI